MVAGTASMADKEVCAKEETLELVCLYESYAEIWDSRNMHYKERDKRTVCWLSMGKSLNTSVAEVQRKIHNLHNQVTNNFPYCTACIMLFVRTGLLICTLHYVRERAKCLVKDVWVW